MDEEVGGDGVLWSGCSGHLGGSFQLPSLALWRAVGNCLVDLGEYFGVLGWKTLRSVRVLSFLERVGDGTGVWEGPAPPSKAFIEHFSRAQSNSDGGTNSK